MGEQHTIKVTCIFSLAKALTQRQPTGVQVLTEEGNAEWPRKCAFCVFLPVPLQCTNDDMHTISTIEIDRHKQRSMYAYIY